MGSPPISYLFGREIIQEFYRDFEKLLRVENSSKSQLFANSVKFTHKDKKSLNQLGNTL